MRSLQFVALMLLAAVSVGPSFFGQNSRGLASEDCINCEVQGSVSDSKNIESNISKLSKSLSSLTKNERIFADLKNKFQCGDNDFASISKSKGRLKNDQKYFIKNDSMYPETDDAQFIFAMNLPSEGRLPSTKSDKPFIGKSFHNDLLMVEKVYSARDVVGFNITISYCSAFSEKDKKLIHDDRELKELAFGGISLDDDNTCGIFNDIDGAQTAMVSKKEGIFGSNFPFQTTFSPIDCDLE